MDLAWVESEGGPMVVVEESMRNLWGGYTNSDYDRRHRVGHRNMRTSPQIRSSGPGGCVQPLSMAAGRMRTSVGA
ncbi:Imm21 family immunity protein [Streptomyces sp. NPDC002520]